MRKAIPLHYFIPVLVFFLPGCKSTPKKDTKAPTQTDTVKTIQEEMKKPVLSNITADYIDSNSGEELTSTVYLRLLETLPNDYEKIDQHILAWSEPKQTIYVINRLRNEVYNGGFNQYYYNLSYPFYKVTPDALKRVGAQQYAKLATAANKTYEKEFKKITASQDGTIEGFSKSYENNPLSQFDDAFYALEKKENLDQLMSDYIKKNKQEFIHY